MEAYLGPNVQPISIVNINWRQLTWSVSIRPAADNQTHALGRFMVGDVFLKKALVIINEVFMLAEW